MNLERRAELYAKGVVTRTELLCGFVDCVAQAPQSVHTLFAMLPADFAPDIQRMSSTNDDEWVASFYPRGIASGEVSVRSHGSFDPTDYAIATLRAIQSLFP